MPRSTSPLRYPGGKTSMVRLVSTIMQANGVDRGVYIEPYAGGGGLALALLFDGHVSAIRLNDVDPAIAALWRCMLDRTEDFIATVEAVPVTVEEWDRQRAIYQSGPECGDEMSFALATLFLNRTNRSGIIKTGGMIGGRKQDGRYRIDCRFNKETIADRIRRVAKYRRQITFTQADALDFLQEHRETPDYRSFMFIDPPYYAAGAELYTSFYTPEDHEQLAGVISAIERPWIVTYDAAPEISRLYRWSRQFAFDQLYSAQTKRTGTELLIASKGLRLPADLRARQHFRPQYRTPRPSLTPDSTGADRPGATPLSVGQAKRSARCLNS
ncbi:DNA adenine methylase [uncultured Jannaschia sp.]|uniref:DNA adenine methylase n=1 Tax=uncultured Jannaschia sp. TaxID=293347 RepID=UPI002635897D|nr:DNA adenine methylase [uncultured Jannaschia sp.]